MARKKKEEQEVFQVEVITKARVGDEGEWEYYVKWAGYDSDSNSWEPQGNVEGCARLLRSFWDHIGNDDKDWPIGYHCSAEDSWIEKEKRSFAMEFGRQEAEEARRKKAARRSKNKERQNRERQTNTPSIESDADDSDALEDVPLANSHPVGKKRKTVVLSDESGNSSDERPIKTSKIRSSNSGVQHKAPSNTAVAPPPSFDRGAVAFDSHYQLWPARPAGQSSLLPSGSRQTHQQRQTHPLVKKMDLPVQSVAAGSSLSTKQRIAQGALTATKPKPAPLTAKPSWKNLGFKKAVKPSNLLASEAKHGQPQTSGSSLPSAQSSIPNAVPYTGVISDVPDIVASPTSLVAPVNDMGPSVNISGQDEYFAPAEYPQDNMDKASEFLAAIMPAELSAPLPQTTLETTVDEPAPPRSLTAAKLPPLKKIPKKWRWTGELFADVSRGKADRLGEVELTDATDAQPGGARFSILLDALNSLRIRRLYDESDLNMILPACGPVHQFGKLGPTDTQDKDAMKALVRYMDVKQQVTFIKLSLDDAEVAMLILFPPTLRDPCDRLAVPAHLTVRGSRESDRLIVVLVPFVLTSAKYKAHEVGMPIDAILRRLPNIDGTDPDGLERRYRSLVSKQYFYRATNILQISQELRDFMSSRSPRPYCIWSSVEDGSSSFTVEANLLKAVLEKCGAPDVGYSAEARVVFVHNGALSTLHKLPALAERRGQRSEVRFFTFGTHETVSPDRWGVREIYPIGGIITFTPSALLNDPFGVYELMTKVTNHPLWECYLLPSVLGFYCQILRGDHESDLSLLSPFLKLVEDGSVAPLWSPPSPGRSFLQGQASWVDWLLETQSQPFPDMLESCVRVFKQKYSDIPVSDQLLNMEAEIAKDMCSMQTQPSIADEYRRFVVIKAPSETHIGWDHEALEWYTADDFDFKDDYFLKEEIE